MTPLTADEAAAFRRAALDAIEIEPGLGAFFKLDYLLRRSFAATIFEGDFRDAYEAVSSACATHHIDTLYCASLTQEALPAFRLPASHDNLRAVRKHYHIPSYVISDNFRSMTIVSDSDYYWGVCARVDIVSDVADRCRELRQTEQDIRPYIESADVHDKRLGVMLEKFHEVCRRSGGATERAEASPPRS